MARRIFTVPTFTPTAVADTTNFTDAAHMSIQGGSATQRVNILEVKLGGQATASAVGIIQLARHSTVGATLTALAGPNTDAASDPATAALAAPTVPFVASTTKPQASATLKLGDYSFNAFGGLIRKTWNPGEGPSIFGASASFGELGINGFTGSSASAAMGGHIEYETL